MAAEADSQLQAIREQSSTSYEKWAGSLSQRQDANVLAAYAHNGAYSGCMQRQGFASIRWQDSVQAAVPTDPMGSDVVLGDPMTPLYSPTYQATAWADRNETILKTPLSKDENLVSLKCREAENSASDDTVSDLQIPPGLNSLTSEWRAGLENLSAPYESLDQLETCMNEAKIPAMSGRSIEDVEDVFSQLRPDPFDIPIGSEPATEEWSKFLALETPLTEAFWSCRKDSYSIVLKMVPSFLEEFENKHESEITKLHEHWLDMESRAARLDWLKSDEVARAASLRG